MYQLFFDNYPIYDPRSDKLRIREPDVHLAVGESGSMSFIIDHGHPYASKITKIKGSLRLVADGSTIWRGRVTKDARDFNLSREIEAEGLLSCLNDSIIPPFNFPEDFEDDPDYQTASSNGNVVQFFLGWLLQQHNSQVSAAQQIQLGAVTVTDPNNYIARLSSGYTTTMDVLKNKLVDILGGYLLPDYSGDTTVLDYYDDLPLTNTQTVEYGGNLLDLVSELDASEIYTAILPVGADGLTLDGLEDGDIGDDIAKDGRILYSKSAVDTYGRITRVVEWKDVTLDINLRTKAIEKLTRDGILQTQTITVKAADLGSSAASAGGEDSAVAGVAVAGQAVVGSSGSGSSTGVARFRVGRYVRLNSSPHGFSATYPLMELDPNLLNPGDTTITMGASVKASSDLANSEVNRGTQEQLNQQQMELNKQQSSITELTQSTQEQVTSAIQTCESIIFSALESYVETSNFEEYKETVSSQLAILSDEISINLTRTTEQIEEVNGDLQSKYESITKYFRFTEDGLYIGESGNEVLLRLDNDIVQFLRANVPELYMDENGVHADELHATSVYIGNMVLQSEPDGRMTLRKAVTA